MSFDDPMDFYGDGVDDAELSSGFAGQDTLPNQWALVTVEAAEAGASKDNKTPQVQLTLRLDDKYALTPKRKLSFIRFYATAPRPPSAAELNGSKGTKGQLSGLLVAFGCKPLRSDFVITKENGPAIVASMAAVLKGRQGIIHVGTEARQNGDQNRVDGYHRVNEENLAALLASGFADKGVTVKERKEQGKTVRYLAAKVKAAGGAGTGAPAASAGVIS